MLSLIFNFKLLSRQDIPVYVRHMKLQYNFVSTYSNHRRNYVIIFNTVQLFTGILSDSKNIFQ